MLYAQKYNHLKKKKSHNMYLSWARFDSTARATCQSSNKLGYSSGSAKDSAALGLIFIQSKLEAKKETSFRWSQKKKEEN